MSRIARADHPLKCSPLQLAFGVVLACVIVGCANRELVRCPLNESDLRKEISAIVPPGTSREEAARKLAKAGVHGSFGGKESKIGPDYYCCQSWQRSGGEVWRINMLLHFDQSGKLTEMLDLPDIGVDPPRRGKAARTASQSAKTSI